MDGVAPGFDVDVWVLCLVHRPRLWALAGPQVHSSLGPSVPWRDGWKRVLAAPAIVAGVFAMTFLLALPLAVTVRGMLASHLGSSLAAETAASGDQLRLVAGVHRAGHRAGDHVHAERHRLRDGAGQHQRRARRARTHRAARHGARAVLVGWAFLSGGILDRYARQRPIRAHGFFAASGVYVFRFLRLAAIAGLIYWWLFAYVHPWLFDTQFDNLTRGMSMERNGLPRSRDLLRRLRWRPARGQPRRRLHEGADRRGGSAQRDRRDRRRLRFIRTHLRQVSGALRVEQPDVSGADRGVGAHRSGRGGRRYVDVGRLRRRSALHRRASAAEASVHVASPDRALPGESRACVLHIGARAGVAGLSGGGSNRLDALSAPQLGPYSPRSSSVRFSGRVTRGTRHGDSHLVLAVTALSLRSLLLQARLAFRLFREPRVPMVLKAVPLLARSSTSSHRSTSFLISSPDSGNSMTWASSWRRSNCSFDCVPVVHKRFIERPLLSGGRILADGGNRRRDRQRHGCASGVKDRRPGSHRRSVMRFDSRSRC